MAERTSAAVRPVALVTGAGSGIGRATARALAARGYRCSLIGRTEATLRETGAGLGAEGEDWTLVAADLSTEAGVSAAAGGTLEAFGRLDALVNNAGWSPLRPIGACSYGQIREIFDVNAVGPLALIAACWGAFERQRSGCVVNVSTYSTIDPFPGLGVYGAAKAALNLIVRGIMNETSAWGEVRPGVPAMRAFAVAPGAVETPLLRSLFPESSLPRERTLEPEAVAEVIVECVVGERDRQVGETILLPSP